MRMQAQSAEPTKPPPPKANGAATGHGSTIGPRVTSHVRTARANAGKRKPKAATRKKRAAALDVSVKRRIDKMALKGVPPMQIAERLNVEVGRIYYHLAKAPGGEPEQDAPDPPRRLPVPSVSRPPGTMTRSAVDTFSEAEQLAYEDCWEERRKLTRAEWLLIGGNFKLFGRPPKAGR